MDPAEYTGVWWLPEAPDRKVAGRLRLADDQIPLLELDGSLETKAREDYPAYPIILGSAGGYLVTLVEAGQVSLNMLSLQHQRLAADYVLIGEHLESQTIPVDEIVFEIDGLADWVALSAIQYTEEVGEGGSLTAVNVTFNPPTDLTVQLDDGCNIAIDFFPSREVSRGAVTVAQAVSVRILPKEQVTLEHLDGHLHALTDLVTFLSGQPSVVTKATALSPDLTYVDVTGTERRVQLDWRRQWARSPSGRALRPTGVVFRLGELRDSWPLILTNWFRLTAETGYALDLLSALAYAPPYQIDLRLLLAAQAAESYHQSMFPGRTHEPPAEFAKRRKRIVDALPPADGSWVVGKLQNSPTLADRLSDLRDKTQEVLPSLHAKFPDWSEAVRQERNRLSHGRGPTQQTHDRLYDLTECTLLVLTACLLLDLGLEPAVCAQIFVNNSRHSRLVR